MNPSTEKEQLQALINANKIRQALEKLQRLASLGKDPDFQQQLAAVAGRYSHLQRQRIAGTLSPADDSALAEGITQALNEIIHHLPAPAVAGRWWFAIPGVVLLALVIFLFWQSRNTSTASNTVTVLVHGPRGTDDHILPKRGVVTLLYGDAIVPETINSDCEATFKQVSDAFFEPDATVRIHFHDGDPAPEPYRATHPDSLYHLVRGKYISLEVKLDHLNEIRGRVQDFITNEGIPGVRIEVQGEVTFTADDGSFTLSIPPDKQQQFQSLRASKPGYQDFEKSDVTPQTRAEVVIPLRRLR